MAPGGHEGGGLVRVVKAIIGPIALVGIKTLTLVGQGTRRRLDETGFIHTLSKLDQRSGISGGAMGEPEQRMNIQNRASIACRISRTDLLL